MSTATQPRHATPRTDQAEIIRALGIIAQPGQVVELRALDATTADDRRPHIESGYFDDAGALAKAVATIKTAKGVYITINPVNPALLARANNRIRAAGKNPLTGDHDIARRLWLPIDVDPGLPAGISATDDEHAAAEQCAREIVDHLSADGWPDGILADSANGWHLLYRIDLPADDGGLVQRVLVALKARWPMVDLTTFNPARIWKLYGTLAAKGDSTPDRPHRMSRMVDVPERELCPVPIDLLETIAGPKPGPTYQANGNGKPYNGAPFDLSRWISDHGLDVGLEQPWQGGGRKWIFKTCPWNPDHTDLSAWVAQRPDGKITAGCHHNGCKGKDWDALRELHEPGYKDRRTNCQSNGHAHHNGQASASKRDDHAAEPIRYERLTCADLDANEYTTEFLIDKLLVAGQPCIVAGGKKTLKTSILIDLGLSLATCRDYLAHFRVMRTANVALMTGESGLATIQETARRIAATKELRLADVEGLIISPDLPRFGDERHMDALREFLKADEIEVLIVDPAYLAIPTEGNEASLFAMGGLLRGMTETCNSVGTMLVLAHHTKKTITDPYAPPELEHIAWSGFPEFARQWILVGRREAYEPGTGEHRLWLNVGGSAGHSGCYAVDIAEGVYDGRTPRYWQVGVMVASDARADAKQRQEAANDAARRSKAAGQLDADRTTIVRAMAKLDKPDTLKAIREWCHLRSDRFNGAMDSLIDDGTVEGAGEISKGNNRPYPAFTLRKETP